MQILPSIHEGLARALLLYLLALAVWAFVAWRTRGVSGGYLGAVVIVEALALAQGAVGALIAVSDRAPRDPLHILYGVAIVVAVPFTYTLARQRDARSRSLVYAVAMFFTFGLAIRGFMTGG